MSVANSRAHASIASPASSESNLFKEDRPRRIDRFISFFGDSRADDDPCGDQLLESLSGDQWSER